MTPDLEEATRKANACWVDFVGPDGESQRADAENVAGALPVGQHLIWHVWHDDALWLVTGGQEQSLPRSSDLAEVTVRTRTGEVLQWSGQVAVIPPDSPEWAAAVAVLHDKRCNAPDGEDQPLRWARESVVLKIVPTGP